MDGNFVCAADLDKIVVWNSKSGKLIKVIPIVPHYNPRDDRQEVDDPYCWKGNIYVLNNLQYETISFALNIYHNNAIRYFLRAHGFCVCRRWNHNCPLSKKFSCGRRCYIILVVNANISVPVTEIEIRSMCLLKENIRSTSTTMTAVSYL